MLFGRERSVIAKHLRNIFKEGELLQEATCAKFAHVQIEGQRTVQRHIDHYNLDAIIFVGYWVNSKRSVHFRQWATAVLRQHLLQGYTLNRQRLAERGMDHLSRTLIANDLAVACEYDEDTLPLPEGCRPGSGRSGL